MDTPGGLDTAMRDIIREILASAIPIVTYVAPSGARAASAGTYILYASHVAAMAPATNLGAATPVQIGGGPGPKPAPDDRIWDERERQKTEEPAPARPETALERKVVNDAVAYIRGLAELRGRNADWAERAVREAATLTARQALDMNVIEIIAADLQDLLRQLDGRSVTVFGEARDLRTQDRPVIRDEPDWRTRVLAVLTDPNIAYILMLIGLYGLIYEFLSPGALVPGIAGAICLLIALFAFQALPVDYAGLGLITLGFAFMIAEAFVPSFGALGIGGLVAFAIGSLMLFDTDAPGMELAWPVIAAVSLVTAAFMFGVLFMALAGRRRPVVSGREAMLGADGMVISMNGSLRVRVQGEVWQARSAVPLGPGQRVRVLDIDGLTLVVEPIEHEITTGRPS